MSAREFASLVVKLIGITAIVAALPKLDNAWQATQYSFSLGADQVFFAVSQLVAVLVGVVGVGLMVFSRRLAARLVADDREIALPCSLSGRHFQAVVFGAAAVLIFILAVPRVFSMIAYIHALMGALPGEPMPGIKERVISSAISSAIQIAVAGWLFVGNRSLVRLWHRFRMAGLEEKFANE